MKKTLRFTSAALTLALAAGMALPAFAAAKPSFSKDETVYAVMAPDGSVTSTTVSAHLYNAAGLSGVTDRSTLTDIVNTESDAAFTQNGDSLTWDTTDTDVYYKGNTSRALPVSAAVTYTLDGETAPLENLLGKSGHLTIRIDLTNNETGTVTVNGAERTVVTPFITAVGVVLGEDASNVTLEHGLLESAASAEALGQDNVFDLSSINSLTDGISQLNDAMQQLLSGASQLVDGVAQLDSGAMALLDGASQLNSGLDQLTEGLDTLTSNNAALTAGAQQVADGVLDSASKTLMEGGLIDTPLTWDNYAAVIDEILTLNDKTLEAGRKKMVRTIWEQAPQFKASQLDLALYLSATKTDSDLEAALRLMQSYSPSIFVAMFQKATDPDARQVIHDELVLQTAQSQDIADVRALKDNLAQIQFFVSSVGQYADGVAAAADGAHAAKDGSTQLVAGAQALLNGANRLVDGTHQLHSGLNQFNEEGISQLTGALDADQLHALKTVLDAMMGRMEEYTSFSGAPEGAVSSMKFLYKTAENVEPAASVVQQAAPAEADNFFVRLWKKFIALFQF